MRRVATRLAWASATRRRQRRHALVLGIVFSPAGLPGSPRRAWLECDLLMAHESPFPFVGRDPVVGVEAEAERIDVARTRHEAAPTFGQLTCLGRRFHHRPLAPAQRSRRQPPGAAPAPVGVGLRYRYWRYPDVANRTDVAPLTRASHGGGAPSASRARAYNGSFLETTGNPPETPRVALGNPDQNCDLPPSQRWQ